MWSLVFLTLQSLNFCKGEILWQKLIMLTFMLLSLFMIMRLKQKCMSNMKLLVLLNIELLLALRKDLFIVELMKMVRKDSMTIRLAKKLWSLHMIHHLKQDLLLFIVFIVLILMVFHRYLLLDYVNKWKKDSTLNKNVLDTLFHLLNMYKKS